MAYEADGQVQKAVELLEQVVEVKEKTLSPEHPDQLASQHALAMAYDANGQTQKGLDLLELVVAIEAECLRDDHPSRLMSVEALADMSAKLAVVSDEGPSFASVGSSMIASLADLDVQV
jgi:hypothetical protein